MNSNKLTTESKEKVIESIYEEINNSEKVVKDIKCSYQNINEKKNRIFEDELMLLELQKNKLSELINKYRNGNASEEIVRSKLEKYTESIDKLDENFNI